MRKFGEGSVNTWLVFPHILGEQRRRETDTSWRNSSLELYHSLQEMDVLHCEMLWCMYFDRRRAKIEKGKSRLGRKTEQLQELDTYGHRRAVSIKRNSYA